MQPEERYLRNAPAVSAEETRRLHEARIAVAGCGGLGGYVLEELARLGVGFLRAIDGDCFEPSNLNRQILATEVNLGQPKARAAKERLAFVNSQTQVEAVVTMITAENAAELLDGVDLVVDALDSLEARLILEDAAEQKGIPLIHGAIGGWYGRVTTVLPGDRSLHRMYRGGQRNLTQKLGTPSFLPPFVASLEVSEAIKVLLNKGEPLSGRILYADLQSGLFRISDILKEA